MCDLHQVHEIGVPVKSISAASLHAGIDADGKACIYAVLGQNSRVGPLLLVRLDPETGECRQFDAPPESQESRALLWSRRWGCMFMAAADQKQDTCGRLLRYDPKRDEIEDLGLFHDSECYMPVSLDEAPDGSLYLGFYGSCSLSRYRPDTGEWAHFGPVDDLDEYLYVRCGDDGTVAGLVKMARPHVVVLDPETGESRRVGPVADTNTQTGHVNLLKAADGLLYIDSHEGWFRVQGMEAVPVAEPPAPAGPEKLPDGSTFRFLTFHDGSPFRCRDVEILSPGGERRVLPLQYEAAGTAIYIVRGGPDGKLYGSSVLPLEFFSYDPANGETVNYGSCSTATGEVYSMDHMDGKLYFCSYTHAILSVYDPARPWQFGAGRGDGTPRLRYARDENDNPRQLGRMDTVAYRPRDMLAGPGGKVWVASVPDYGMWGGTLSWYDPTTDTFGGAHRNIYQDCSGYSLAYLPERDLLAVGFTIHAGSGTDPRAERTGLALWDPNADAEVWRGDLGLGIVGVMDLEYAGDGLVYAIIHPTPADVLKAELLLLDLPGERVVSRRRLDDVAGWPLEVSFQRDDAYVYGATRTSIYRVPLGTTDVEVLWTSDTDGPNAPGALLEGRYYFATYHRLRAVDVSDPQ